MTTPTQQIEAAAEKAAAELLHALNDGIAEVFGETYEPLPADITTASKHLLRFAAQLMQTEAMKEVEASLQRMAYDYQDDTRERQMGCARYMRQEARGAIAALSAVKKMGEGTVTGQE